MDGIERYERSYRGSDAELQDLKELYTRFDGEMNRYAAGRGDAAPRLSCADAVVHSVFDWLCCSRPEVDSHRFMVAVQAAIDAGASACLRSRQRCS